MIILLAAVAWLLLSARRGTPPQIWAGVTAGLTALATHSAVDFLWHLPAIPLLAAALMGLATPAGPGPAASPGPNPLSGRLAALPFTDVTPEAGLGVIIEVATDSGASGERAR